MTKLELSICECCGQVITRHLSDAAERHLKTIDYLYGVSFEEIKTQNKTHNVVEARQHFWLLVCIEDEWSTPRAARKTGHDHTTVVYGIRMFAHRLLGTHKKASIKTIAKAYWLATGMTEELANAKAEKRTQGR